MHTVRAATVYRAQKTRKDNHFSGKALVIEGKDQLRAEWECSLIDCGRRTLPVGPAGARCVKSAFAMKGGSSIGDQRACLGVWFVGTTRTRVLSIVVAGMNSNHTWKRYHDQRVPPPLALPFAVSSAHTTAAVPWPAFSIVAQMSSTHNDWAHCSSARSGLWLCLHVHLGFGIVRRTICAVNKCTYLISRI